MSSESLIEEKFPRHHHQAANKDHRSQLISTAISHPTKQLKASTYLATGLQLLLRINTVELLPLHLSRITQQEDWVSISPKPHGQNDIVPARRWDGPDH
jgi:hypothetical protein